MATSRNPSVSFAVAYLAYHTADTEASKRVWQDLLVQAADRLGIQDDELEGLRDHRNEVKRRDEDFMANYRKQA